MEYTSVADTAKRWGVSPRSVRNYCAQGRVEGAFLTGKTWNIPADAAKPARANATTANPDTLLARLQDEKASRFPGGIYHKLQIELTYNSNRIEGSRLTHDQTRLIFETRSIVPGESGLRVDDIIETANHFRCIDYIIDHATDALSEVLVKELHRILKTSTEDAGKEWFSVGDYKRLPNEVGGRNTSAPEEVARDVRALLDAYDPRAQHSLEEIVGFHVSFERIHPFQDGNGRVGRLVAFKECLRSGVIPFVITDELKPFYYRGLSLWDKEHGWLMDTCRSAQDAFAKWLDYFRIAH